MTHCHRVELEWRMLKNFVVRQLWPYLSYSKICWSFHDKYWCSISIYYRHAPCGEGPSKHIIIWAIEIVYRSVVAIHLKIGMVKLLTYGWVK